ncbi:MAG: hypothetical protein EBX41_00915 [Chitinophagia bacterium]|nr:hypothetical protein [Chitinophagia bacterium]
MKYVWIILLLASGVGSVWGQQTDLKAKAKQITEDGKTLYYLELAAWYGTDFFLAGYKGDRNQVGGYLSYPDKDNIVCIFFDKGAVPQVLGTITYLPSNMDHPKAVHVTRRFTPIELQYYQLRAATLKAVAKDRFFVAYNNCNLTPVPIIRNNTKKVYVFTTSDLGGLIIFGNDYELTFNAANEITEKKIIHKSIFTHNYINNATAESNHKHTTTDGGDFMTPSDVCVLMLNQAFTKWNKYVVTSANYRSEWNCKTNQLTLTPLKAKK